MKLKRYLLSALITSLATISVADEVKPINPDAGHVERWNWFVDAVYALHKQQIAGLDIKKTYSTGGYFREPEFFKEVQYIDKATHQRISTIRWERKNPELIHWIEVLIYDDRGWVKRDYAAAFLTEGRNAPQQTLINLHVYHGKLHAYRQFDATDNRIYEFCEGKYKGKAVNISYDEMDIIEFDGVKGGPLDKPVYKICFKGLPVKSAGKYLIPQ